VTITPDGGRGQKFATRVAILAATLLCEKYPAYDPRLRNLGTTPARPRALTFKEARQILEDYGVRTTG
jgi:hypothetical protein